MAGLSRRSVASQIAFVPQHTDSVYSYSAVEMVLMGRHPFSGFAAVDSPADVEAAMTALHELEISHLAHRKYGQLSGGEQQLVLLARAFAQHTPVLILDEPLTGLDLRHQYQLMHALSRAAAGAGQRGILATFHDLAIAARWCTRMILLSNGRVIAAGPARQVITPEKLAAAYGIEADIKADVTGEMTIQVTGYASPVDS
jgi:iron complex transport system ATP-binding protein